MSGTFSMVALRCASAGTAASTARTTDEVRIRFIEASSNFPFGISILGESRENGERPRMEMMEKRGIESGGRWRCPFLPIAMAVLEEVFELVNSEMSSLPDRAG